MKVRDSGMPEANLWASFFDVDLILSELHIDSMQKEYLNGQLVSQTEKDNNGNVQTIRKFKRNASNDVVEHLIILSKDNKEYKFTYEYEYDSAGNWIKQTRFYDGQIENIVLRNIEYFKSAT